MKLYITRHGQTEWNVERRMQGWMDSALTEKGVSNAKALAKHLESVEFAEVYASPAQRTMRTAQIICEERSMEIIPDENLREIHLGDWEGKQAEEIERHHSESFNAFWKAPHIYKKENAESFYEVQERALKNIKAIVKKHGHTDHNILVVTHAVTLKTIMAYFENRAMERLWDLPYIYDTSLSVVEIKDGEVHILLHGDTTHLNDAVGY